jgi:signal transduction histidine kinase
VGNVHKDAAVTRITVRVREITAGLLVDVTDDGTGGVTLEGSGTGLRGMRERVAAHGGALTVDSPPVGATTIRAVLPCG